VTLPLPFGQDAALEWFRRELETAPEGVTEPHLVALMRGAAQGAHARRRGAVPTGGYNPGTPQCLERLAWLCEHGYMREFVGEWGGPFFVTSDAGHEIIGPARTWRAIDWGTL